MSFLNNLAGMFGGGNSGDMLKTVTDAIGQMGGDQLAGHMNTIASNADGDTRAQLGQHLLDALTQHTGDANAAAAAAGTTPDAVASGSNDAITSIINYAKSNPQILQTAATAFMTKNPGALTSLLPSLGGLMGGNK